MVCAVGIGVPRVKTVMYVLFFWLKSCQKMGEKGRTFFQKGFPFSPDAVYPYRTSRRYCDHRHPRRNAVARFEQGTGESKEHHLCQHAENLRICRCVLCG